MTTTLVFLGGLVLGILCFVLGWHSHRIGIADRRVFDEFHPWAFAVLRPDIVPEDFLVFPDRDQADDHSSILNRVSLGDVLEFDEIL